MNSYPQIWVHPKAVKKLRNHYLWLYADEIEKIEQDPSAGATVVLLTGKGEKLGIGFYHPSSHIRVRLISINPNEKLDKSFFQSRIRQAIALRQSLQLSSSRRLIHAEADFLPGLIVDQYNEYLVLQIRNMGMERFRSLVVSLLRTFLHPKGILERSDMSSREEEGLPECTEVIWGDVPNRIRIEEQNASFWVDPYHGQKTGFYLDQSQTQKQFANYIKPNESVLDAFQYTGRFGIISAKAGARVVGIDREEKLIALAKENAQLNNLKGSIDFIVGDAFYLLEAKAQQGETFDWVILDPPCLAKTRGEIQHGRYLFQKMTYNALQCVKPNGKLLISLCTYHLQSIFEEVLRISAGDLGKRIWCFDQSLQSPDHPYILQMPETRYLRSLFCQILG